MDDVKRTAKDMSDEASRSADDAYDTAKTYMGRARDKVSEQASTAADAAQGAYGRARGQIQDAAATLPGSASDAVDAGRRVYTRGNKQLSRQVVKQPIEALLLAGAIGYLVGWATNLS